MPISDIKIGNKLHNAAPFYRFLTIYHLFNHKKAQLPFMTHPVIMAPHKHNPVVKVVLQCVSGCKGRRPKSLTA